MSTKIYNAYKLKGDYNLISLNEFCNNLRKEVTKISEQTVLDWIVNKTLYYYNFKKLHGSQAVQNMIMQTKNFKEMHEIWKLVDVDRWDNLYWNISDMALERNLQNQRKREIIQIFPLQDKILVMFFGSKDIQNYLENTGHFDDSLGSAIAWHLMMDAQAHDYSKENIGSSKHFESGEALIRINGPSGTSELWVKIISNDYNKVWYTTGSGKKKKTYYYKNQSGSDFIATQGHTYTVKWGKGGRGPYDLHVKEQTITPTKNNSGNYTGISFEVVFGIPAHQQHTAQNYAVADSPNDAKTGQMLQCWSGNDNGFWQHSKHIDYDRMYGSNDDNDDNEEKITINMSLANTGLCTNYGTRYVGSSLTFNLEYPSGTMIFDGNGGQLKQNDSEGWQNSVSRTLKDRDPYGTFPQGSRSGYELDSFNSKADGTGMEIEEDWQFCGTWTVYAIWKPKTYSISYDAGDGDGDMSETSATYNKTVTLSQNKFTRKGYKFLGWSLKNDGSSVDYQNGASFTYDKADDITLYAVWEKDNYEVKFHGNGSSAADYTRNLPYNKTTNLPENVFERPGYTFMGWAPEEELDRYKVIPKYTNGAEVKDLCEPGETCNLYAIWRKTDGSFETKNIIHDDKMFFGDVNITGGNGTEYDQGMYDSKAAKIDKENDPGYFTDRYKKED